MNLILLKLVKRQFKIILGLFNYPFFSFCSSESESEENGAEGEATGDKKVENAAKDEAIEWLEHRAKQAFRKEKQIYI